LRKTKKSFNKASILNAPTAKGQQPTANKKEVQQAKSQKLVAKSLRL